MSTASTPDNSPFSDFPSIGAVMASRLIADEKQPVRFLYREKPINDQDSGWRLFSGTEDDTYASNPANSGVYDPQTILAIDPTIADLLLNPTGSAFERDDNEDWYEVSDFEFEDDFPTTLPLTTQWSITLSNLFTHYKDEEGDVVFVTKGRTVRIAIWDYPGETALKLYEDQRTFTENRNEDADAAPTIEAFMLSDDAVYRIGYIIEESDEDNTYHVLHACSIVNEQVVQAAFYFDDENDREWALNTWKGIAFKHARD